MSSFDSLRFKEVYPVSFLMRETLRSSWFRIHSLPESKRYPETQAEWNILVERHLALTDIVLNEGGQCRIHYTLFDDSRVPELLMQDRTWSAPSAISYNGDEIFTQSTEATWRFEDFLPWIKLRANDEIGWLSFHSLDTDAIYSPYDGGADIFSLDAEFMSRVKIEFSDWKSPHSKGL